MELGTDSANSKQACSTRHFKSGRAAALGRSNIFPVSQANLELRQRSFRLLENHQATGFEIIRRSTPAIINKAPNRKTAGNKVAVFGNLAAAVLYSVLTS